MTIRLSCGLLALLLIPFQGTSDPSECPALPPGKCAGTATRPLPGRIELLRAEGTPDSGNCAVRPWRKCLWQFRIRATDCRPEVAKVRFVFMGPRGLESSEAPVVDSSATLGPFAIQVRSGTRNSGPGIFFLDSAGKHLGGCNVPFTCRMCAQVHPFSHPGEEKNPAEAPEPRPGPPSLTPAAIQSLAKLAAGLTDSVRKRYGAFRDDFQVLDSELSTTGGWVLFGPFTREDFPEITNGHQGMILAHGLATANVYPPLYFESLGDPERKELLEKLVLSERNPSLAVTVKPQFHLVRLTNWDARLFPKDLVEPVRKLWRDALVQAVLLREQRDVREAALLEAARKEGVAFPWNEEDAFPALAALDKKLLRNRQDYLGNLERLFRKHGLTKDR